MSHPKQTGIADKQGRPNHLVLLRFHNELLVYIVFL